MISNEFAFGDDQDIGSSCEAYKNANVAPKINGYISNGNEIIPNKDDEKVQSNDYYNNLKVVLKSKFGEKSNTTYFSVSSEEQNAEEWWNSEKVRRRYREAHSK